MRLGVNDKERKMNKEVLKIYLESKMVKDKIESHRQKEELDNYLIELEESISGQAMQLIESGLKDVIDFVYGQRYDGKLRYRNGESYRTEIWSIYFEYPRDWSIEEVAQELFYLPRLNIWQKIKRAFTGKYLGNENIIINEENSVKLPSLNKLFGQLKKIGFEPLLRLVWGHEHKAQIIISIAYTKGKKYF